MVPHVGLEGVQVHELDVFGDGLQGVEVVFVPLFLVGAVEMEGGWVRKKERKRRRKRRKRRTYRKTAISMVMPLGRRESAPLASFVCCQYSLAVRMWPGSPLRGRRIKSTACPHSLFRRQAPTEAVLVVPPYDPNRWAPK